MEGAEQRSAMGEFDDFDLFDWFLGTDGNANANGDGSGDFPQSSNVSPMQISVNQGCSTDLLCDVPMASQFDLHASLNELGMMDSPLSQDSVHVPDTVGHEEQPLSREVWSNNLIVEGTNSSGWEFSGRHDGGKQVQKKEAKRKAIEDASLSNDCPRKQRSRNAEKHNQAEKKRRHKFNQRIRTLQSIIPEVDKVDTASVLDNAIDYVKTLQLHVILEKMNPTATPLGASTAALQSVQHPQFGSMEPRSNGEMSFNDFMSVIQRSMAQSYLSRAFSLPQFYGFPSQTSPPDQMPYPPAGLQFEGFHPPHWLGPAALGIPMISNHQQLPLQTQDVGETLNIIMGGSNCGAGSS